MDKQINEASRCSCFDRSTPPNDWTKKPRKQRDKTIAHPCQHQKGWACGEEIGRVKWKVNNGKYALSMYAK